MLPSRILRPPTRTRAARRRLRPRNPASQAACRAERLREVARWPLEECLLNADWRERGIGAVVFARRAPAAGGEAMRAGRERAVVGLVVDLFCFGVRDVRVAVPTDLAGQHDLVEAVAGGWPMRRVDPHLAAKVVHAGHAWAEALGLPQDPSFGWARPLFEGIDHQACAEEVRCGRDGKPVVFAGPPEPTQRLVAHLERQLGPGRYHLVAPLEQIPES